MNDFDFRVGREHRLHSMFMIRLFNSLIQTLKDLRLFNNQIGDNGAGCLAEALKVNQVSESFNSPLRYTSLLTDRNDTRFLISQCRSNDSFEQNTPFSSINSSELQTIRHFVRNRSIQDVLLLVLRYMQLYSAILLVKIGNKQRLI